MYFLAPLSLDVGLLSFALACQVKHLASLSGVCKAWPWSRVLIAPDPGPYSGLLTIPQVEIFFFPFSFAISCFLWDYSISSPSTPDCGVEVLEGALKVGEEGKTTKATTKPALVACLFFFLIEVVWRKHSLGCCPCLKENADRKKMLCLRSCSALLCA